MRFRIPIGCFLILALCTAAASFGWYQDRARHVVVEGGTLRTGTLSKADPSAYIISHGATLHLQPDHVLQIEAFVRDVPGATIRCSLESLPNEGGTQALSGGSIYGNKIVMWRAIRIDPATWAACALGLRPAPKYVLDYSVPRSDRWTAASRVALFAGPILAGGYWAALSRMRRARDARPGFEVLTAQELVGAAGRRPASRSTRQTQEGGGEAP